VSALRNCVVDDVHLGIRFADLLETLTSRLRSRFISAPAPPVDEPHKRARSPVQNPDPKRAKHSPHNTIREWQAGTPNYGISQNPTPNHNGFDSVSATPFDLNSGAFYGNPPHNQAQTYGVDMTEQLFGGNDWAGNEMWYLPPGPEFYNNVNNQTITQTAEGVNVGGMDLLDYMTLGDLPMMDSTQYSGP